MSSKDNDRSGRFSILAGIPYGTPDYKKFQRFWYGPTDANNPGINYTAPLVQAYFHNNPSEFQWGCYQTQVVPQSNWPSVPGFWGPLSAFDLWNDAAKLMRDSLQQQANPQGPGTLLDMMNDFHRQAFWPAPGNNPIPLNIKVTKKPKWTRKHGAECQWDNPGHRGLLNVTAYCPNIGKRQQGQWESDVGGWLAWALCPKPHGAGSITRLKATIQVPQGPVSTADPQQLLYLFPGLQAQHGAPAKKPGMLQPILQWGFSPVPGIGGGPNWYVGSWYVGEGQPWETIQQWQISGIQQLRSSTTALLCDIAMTGSTGGNLFNYTCKVTGNDGTIYPGLDVQGVPELDLAAIALECYGVNACTDFPATPSLQFTDISIEIDNRPVPNPAWASGKITPPPFPDCQFSAVPSQQPSGATTIAISRAS